MPLVWMSMLFMWIFMLLGYSFNAAPSLSANLTFADFGYGKWSNGK
jgi:hypothetical protein